MPRPARKRNETAVAPEDAGAPAAVLEPEQEVAVPSRREVTGPGDLSVEARVVYLGGNVKKSLRYSGSVMTYENEQGQVVYLPSEEGGTCYDFTRFDTRRRLIKERLTKDNHIFSLCRHIGHLVMFRKELDEDGSPQFEVRATPAVAEKIERYERFLAAQEARTTDRGRPVLAAMGLI